MKSSDEAIKSLSDNREFVSKLPLEIEEVNEEEELSSLESVINENVRIESIKEFIDPL
jgi:uncharacterized protein (DUF1786 family)